MVALSPRLHTVLVLQLCPSLRAEAPGLYAAFGGFSALSAQVIPDRDAFPRHLHVSRLVRQAAEGGGAEERGGRSDAILALEKRSHIHLLLRVFGP